jgi:hypothetical protein
MTGAIGRDSALIATASVIAALASQDCAATLAPLVDAASLPEGKFGYLHMVLFSVVDDHKQAFLEFLLPHAQETADLRNRTGQAFVAATGSPRPRNANYLLVKEDPLPIEAPVPMPPPWMHRGSQVGGGRLLNDTNLDQPAFQILRALGPKVFPSGYAISSESRGLQATYGVGGRYRQLIAYHGAKGGDPIAFEAQFIESSKSFADDGHLSAQPFVIHVGRRFEMTTVDGKPRPKMVDTDGSDWPYGRYIMTLETNVPVESGIGSEDALLRSGGRPTAIILQALTPKRFAIAAS